MQRLPGKIDYVLANRAFYALFARLVCVAFCLSGSAVAQTGDRQEPAIGESVSILHDATRLSGSLLTPVGTGPHPVFVAIEGSGDWSYRRSWGSAAFPFWKEIAEFLLARGYAVLLYDKPGVNESTGDWRQQSFDDRADEVVSAVRMLAARSDIDPTQIGLIGHSQGGWIAQIAAARHPDEVAFVILLAGPAVSVKAQIRDDVESRWACDDVSGAGLAIRQAALRVGLSALGFVSHVAKPGYLSRIIHFDPDSVLPEIQQPMLAIFAGNDPLVLPEVNRLHLERRFGTEHGNRRLAVATVPGADHFFRASARCPRGQRPTDWAADFFAALDHAEFWSWVRSGNQPLDGSRQAQP